jgi:hypothetical protein
VQVTPHDLWLLKLIKENLENEILCVIVLVNVVDVVNRVNEWRMIGGCCSANTTGILPVVTAPVVLDANPKTLCSGATSITLTITGSGFDQNSQVLLIRNCIGIYSHSLTLPILSIFSISRVSLWFWMFTTARPPTCDRTFRGTITSVTSTQIVATFDTSLGLPPDYYFLEVHSFIPLSLSHTHTHIYTHNDIWICSMNIEFYRVFRWVLKEYALNSIIRFNWRLLHLSSFSFLILKSFITHSPFKYNLDSFSFSFSLSLSLVHTPSHFAKRSKVIVFAITINFKDSN